MVSKKTKDINVGIVAGMADLYNRVWPDLPVQLDSLLKQLPENLKADNLKFLMTGIASTKEQFAIEVKKLVDKDVDLIVVSLAPYCASGVMSETLSKTNVPLLLWPTQTIFELEPENYDMSAISLNHGVHAVQDLSNVLRKNGKAVGVIHGHWKQDDFKEEFVGWAKAARAIRSMAKANPVQIGGHFEDMLDLQIGADAFIDKLGIKHTEISLDEFCEIFNGVQQEKIEQYVSSYRSKFVISDGFNKEILDKAARGDIALREVMEKYNSSAFGLNFLELCNDSRLAEPLHLAGSVQMSEGLGYAAEGDWVTAAFVYAMQQAFGIASFSEIFSVGYNDNRLVLRHWGEGNFEMAREDSELLSSALTDLNKAEFAIVNFEFEPGQITLLNINSTPDGCGQIITIAGEITKDKLPKTDGPRAIFKPACKDVRELLTNYAYNGGSHHLVMVKGDGVPVAEKICKLIGWKHVSL